MEVVDASSPTTVIASFSGTQLVDSDCNPPGDCKRLRRLPHAVTASNEIAGQESRALFLDFAFDTADQAPTAVLHHVYAMASNKPSSKEPIGPVDYLAAPFDISAGTPIVIGPPVKGDRWMAINGCCEPGFPHRTSTAALNGMLVNSQRFAIDWKQVNESGAFFEGDPTKNESYVDYGSTIIAVADGTITSLLDGMDANTPGVLPSKDPVLAPLLTVANVDGNHIIQDSVTAPGLYATSRRGRSW